MNLSDHTPSHNSSVEAKIDNVRDFGYERIYGLDDQARNGIRRGTSEVLERKDDASPMLASNANK